MARFNKRDILHEKKLCVSHLFIYKIKSSKTRSDFHDSCGRLEQGSCSACEASLKLASSFPLHSLTGLARPH